MSTAALQPPLPALAEARQNHASGNLLQAAESYRQALQSNPNSAQALLGLSLIARQSDQLEPALRMAEAALAAAPGSALAWANLGDILNALQSSTAAKTAFRQALALDPTVAAAHYGLGNALALEDDFTEALTHFRYASERAPASPECHFAEAFAHGKLGDRSQAIADYRRAVHLRPSFGAAWLNLGVELVADGRDHLAEPCYCQALAAIQGNHPAQIATRINALLNLGHLHRSRGHFTQAQLHYQAAFDCADANPARYAEIHIAFAYFHIEQQQLPQAWRSIREAEATDPAHENAELPNALGVLLLAEETARHDAALIAEAIEAFKQAEALGNKTAASNRGNALLRLGRCTEAEAAHRASLARDPTHPGVRYNLALTQLRLGNFTEGWLNYEARWQFREVHPRPRRFAQPRWRGEDLPQGSRLFLYGEQGLGDTLQFFRYLSLVASRLPSISLVLEVQPPLMRLLASNLAGLQLQLIPHGQTLPPSTHHCPLLSLPAVFQTTLETVPHEIPYLQADPLLSNQRDAELTDLGQTAHPRIGLNWAGNPQYRADHERSTTLQTFRPLLEIPSIRWISLQHGPPSEQVAQFPIPIHDLSSHDRDLADTAALIAHLDLVITTDTAIAHLAGALGKPLWLLLPWQSDWRWMQDCLTTPWYPQARLFRQASPHNWPELVARVAAELRSFIQTLPAL